MKYISEYLSITIKSDFLHNYFNLEIFYKLLETWMSMLIEIICLMKSYFVFKYIPLNL